jgi:glycosyltransferase involved in cell wall biosynthesis
MALMMTPPYNQAINLWSTFALKWPNPSLKYTPMTAHEAIPNCQANTTELLPVPVYRGDAFNICLLGYRSHPHVGGQGIYLHYLSKALADLGHKVDVISGPPYPELDPRVKLIKLPSLDLFAEKDHVTAIRPRHLKSFSDTFEWFSMLTGGFSEPYTFGRRVVKYLKNHEHNYDIVHDNQCLAYGLLSLQKSGLPTVATVHHPITRDRKLALDAAPNWKYRLLIKRWHSFLGMQSKVVRKLNHIITVSEQSRQDISSAFKRPVNDIDLMYNGIDTEIFRPLANIEKQQQLLITTASADQPLKGLRYLLEAIALLKPSYPDLKLIVIGKLHAGGETEKRLQNLQLMNSVEFISGISTECLVEHYNRASIAVSPSLYEGFGLPAGEAMACETPVISSDGGALPEVVGDAGLVVPAANDVALADAIKDLLDHPEKRNDLARLGRQRIVKSFSWAVKAQRLSHYYNTILEKHSAS